jgi:uncharacterized cupredoxin-like copper-binding protein
MNRFRKETAMFTKSRSLLVLFAAMFLITSACGRVPADSIGAVATPIDQAVQEEADHADDGDDHAEEAVYIEPSGDADRVVEVDLSEFAIDAHSFEFSPGETIEFIITNSGVVEHEFRLSNQVRVDEHVAGGHADHDDAMSDEEMAEMDHEDGEMTDEEMAELGVDEAHEDDGHAHEAEQVHEEEGHDSEEAHEEEGDAVEVDHESEEGHDADVGHEVEDAVLVLGPGETGTLVFTFPENDHDFTAAVCLIPGHYEAGMATDLGYGA